MPHDLTNPRWIKLKGGLFLLLGLAASTFTEVHQVTHVGRHFTRGWVATTVGKRAFFVVTLDADTRIQEINDGLKRPEPWGKGRQMVGFPRIEINQQCVPRNLMIASNLEIGPGREAGVARGVWEIELSALRRAAKLVEKVQVLNTPWPASMYLGTALEALKAAERLIENGNGDGWGSSG